ncbi:major outer membrane protein [Arcobacter caeni]|uniref:Porin domain-containing protein n=1 Tax=Arcobacter caeni TaxID=1912877 RepID=A0A363D0Z0_9BACT|nr:major outer membrane protein [Arcobacter caeni]PUE64979.1 hypothetical protein B0174_05595 [Arcobacter caeni]
MKKIAKLSLVAAVAVMGLTTANAQPLEEAIKNVEVTGSVVYRYNDNSNDTTAGSLYNGKLGADKKDLSKESSATNNYKVALGLSSKVNDDVKFNSRFVVGAPTSTGTGDAGFASLNSSENGDQNVGTELTNAYFGYTGIKNTTVNVGKQGLTTPWTVAVDSDGNEQTGTGILALSTVGPVTLAAAYFNQTNLNNSLDAKLGGFANDTSPDEDIIDAAVVKGNVLDGSEDIATIGAIVVAGPVTIDAWYLDAQDKFDSYTVGAKSSLDLSGVKLGIDARYASLSLDKSVAVALKDVISANGVAEEDNSIAKLALTAKAGIFDAKVAYAMTGKEGGLTALDNDATTTLLGWSITSNGKADADYWQVVAGVDILSNLNLSANYGNIQYIAAANSTVDVEEEEIYAQLMYKMSKNLNTYVRYGTYTKEASDNTSSVDINDDVRGRLQVEYTF